MLNNIEEATVGEIIESGLHNFIIIDVRTEKEFAEDHIPSAINIPILLNEDRVKVGTCYKQVGTKAAKFLAMELLSPRLPSFIKQIDDIEKSKKTIIINCWRGGLRSGATVALLALAGIRAIRLKGGYAEFRRVVHNFFENFPEDINFVTVFGKTGCAKSEILRALEKEGEPIIDLERAARHKGSSFGDVGEVEYKDVTQKSFETEVWHSFYINKNSKKFFIEGESPKIGKVNIPQKLNHAMRSGIKIMAEAPLDFRIKFTISNYEPNKYIDEIKASLLRIKRYIGNNNLEILLKDLDNGEFAKFTEYLLVHYYDPMYLNSIPKDISKNIFYHSIEEGVKQLKDASKV